MWSSLKERMHVNRWVAVGCFTLVVAVSAGDRVAAQNRRTVIMMKAALQTYAPDHTVRTIVSELGTGRGRVFIELRNHRNELVASGDGELTARTPVVLDFRVPNGELTLLGTAVRIETSTPLTTVPAATLEEIGPDQLTAKPRTLCSHGPPSGRDSAQTLAFCQGWSVSTFLAGGV